MRSSNLKVPAYVFPLTYAGLTLGGLLMCLLLTVRLHYAGVVRTHCKTWEFWPSISATTGDYMPERAVWRVAIALCSGPRILTSFLLYSLFRSYVSGKGESSVMIKTSLGFDMLRIACATGWAFVTSTEHNTFHECCFAAYIISGFVYQITQTILCSKYCTATSYRIKRTLLYGQIVFAIGVGYFYYDHRMTCLPGRYSRSTVCEWLFSISNILFDASQYLDVQNMSINFQPMLGSAEKGDEDETSGGSSWYHRHTVVLICETFLSTLLFSGIMQFYQVTYFIPMVQMKFTQETAILLAPFFLSLFGFSSVRRFAMGSTGQAVFLAFSLLSLFATDVAVWTEMKLLVAGTGYTMSLFAFFGRMLRQVDSAPGFLLGLIVFNILRLGNYSLDPIHSSQLINGVALFFGLFCVFVVSHQQYAEEPPEANLASGRNTSKVSVFREGFTLGSYLFLLIWLFSEHGILSRWVGLDPFPSGSFVIGALLFGLYAQVKYPTLISQQHQMYGFLGSSFILYYGSRYTIIMEGESTESTTVYGYYGWPVISYCGGIVLAFLTAYVGPPLLESIVRSREHLGKIMTIQYVSQLFFLLGAVYTVCFPFVPGGSLFRNRMNLLLFPMVGFVATYPLKPATEAPSHRTGGARKVLALGLVLVFVLLISTVLLRGMVDLKASASLTAESKSSPGRFLRAAIWTIHYGLDDYGTDSFPHIVSLLESIDSPIIGLLETDLSRPMNGNRDIIEYAAAYLNMYSDYGPTTLDNTFGCALLSKYRILSVNRYIAPSPMGELACHIHAFLDVAGKTVQVHVAHFGNTEHWLDRRLHSGLLGNLLINNPGPAIFLGYLTTKAGSEYYRLIVNETTGMQDTGKAVETVPWSKTTDPKIFPRQAYKMEKTGRVTKDDPMTIYTRRYCEYVLFRGMTLADFEDRDTRPLSDTEVQIGTFEFA